MSTNAKSSVAFDDFLGLMARDLSPYRVIVFHGRSGSGKSSAIRFLLEHHRVFRGRTCDWLNAPLFRPSVDNPELIVADDLTHPAQYAKLLPMLARGRTLLLASHLPLHWHHIVRPLARSVIFLTDRDHGKIRRYLASMQITASDAAVAAFVQHFGATYTDVDIILECCPGRDFDRALSRFLRSCKVQTT